MYLRTFLQGNRVDLCVGAETNHPKLLPQTLISPLRLMLTLQYPSIRTPFPTQHDHKKNKK